MSKIFYDHLVVLDEIEHHIRHGVETPEEKEELWHLVDEIIHHRIIGCILDHLPKDKHKKFIKRLHMRPYDDGHLDYLKMHARDDIEDVIRSESEKIRLEIMELISGSMDNE